MTFHIFLRYIICCYWDVTVFYNTEKLVLQNTFVENQYSYCILFLILISNIYIAIPQYGNIGLFEERGQLEDFWDYKTFLLTETVQQHGGVYGLFEDKDYRSDG